MSVLSEYTEYQPTTLFVRPYMHFRIVVDLKTFTLNYGQSGRELSAFLPESIEWSQLNYGQGEGQVSYLGCEWGFYLSASGIDVHIHSGIIEIGNAIDLLRLVQEHVFGSKNIPSRLFLEAFNEST